ncbi:MAG TPA: class 1 fructose-bisphosphatase [Herpetosiphonaceae bacterium]|nr:class 1 fructose-bisphosphatase [Herpetosiphonaceae bacterium]
MPVQEIMTIDRFISESQSTHPGATGELSNLLYDIALAAKLIAREVSRAGLNDILGLAGGINVQGEQQKKLDVFADETIVGIMSAANRAGVIASEEDEEVIPVGDEVASGKYALVFDPLDGSSNTDVNVGIATIFGIYRRVTRGGPGELADVLQPGRDLVAAGYVLYGSSTMLVYSAGDGVHAFTLEPSLGEFLLMRDNIRIPEKPRYFSANNGYQRYWSPGVRAYTAWLQGLDPERPRKPLSSRYIGSFAADFHRNLIEGGVFYYPADGKDAKLPNGKLRLVYEAAPMAFLAEQAGGAASDGRQPILDIVPRELHQRTPLFIGSAALVAEAEAHLRRFS